MGKLGFLEIGVDEDIGQRHQRGDALPGLHEISDLRSAVSDHAVDRGADLCERQVALGLGERVPELFEGARSFVLLRLQHADIGDGAVERGLRAQDGGVSLVAVGNGLFERLPACEFFAGQGLLALEFGLHPPLTRLRRSQLSL
jgi:hypothetical protein